MERRKYADRCGYCLGGSFGPSWSLVVGDGREEFGVVVMEVVIYAGGRAGNDGLYKNVSGGNRSRD